MPYVGGKSQPGVFERIVNLLPPHDVFIEPFAGSAAVARLKKPASETILVDLRPSSADPALQALKNTRVLQGCGIRFLETYRPKPGQRVLVYVDPPYVLSTRGDRRYYDFEMEDADHRRLVRILEALPFNVIVSGYASAIYDVPLGKWNREAFEVMTRGNTWKTEILWFNYPRPTHLHDFSKVGSGFRDRWRIKKKVARWTSQLKRQDPLERAALFSALLTIMGESGARIALEDAARNSTIARSADPGDGARRRPSPDPAGPAVTELRPESPAPSQLELVLSVFPGIDLLGRGFEQAGFVVVRGLDVIWGGNVREFHPPAGKFKGVIGGPPCQDFSRGRRKTVNPPTGNGLAMIGEFARVVLEADPDWFLMENVPGVPSLEVRGYSVQVFNLNASECGGRQRRLRVFQFGTRDATVVILRRGDTAGQLERTCMAREFEKPNRRGFPDFCELQGLPRDFDLPGLCTRAKYTAVGNGVPVYMARTIAEAIRDRIPGGFVRLCACGCGERVQGKATYAAASCRKRAERRRAVTRPSMPESGSSRILELGAPDPARLTSAAVTPRSRASAGATRLRLGNAADLLAIPGEGAGGSAAAGAAVLNAAPGAAQA